MTAPRPTPDLSTRLALSLQEVCDLLGISTRSYWQRKTELDAAGFPARLPGMNRYSAEAVRDWLARNSVPAGARDDAEAVQ